MTIKNAIEASEIVRDFLARMGWADFTFPIEAEEINGTWIVKFKAGVKDMKFELNSKTGEIIKYETLQ